MTITEARKIIREYEYKSVITDDEEFLLLEALEFMIDATKDTQWMVRLGGYHYDKRNFDLALKYYEMADPRQVPHRYVPARQRADRHSHRHPAGEDAGSQKRE